MNIDVTMAGMAKLTSKDDMNINVTMVGMAKLTSKIFPRARWKDEDAKEKGGDCDRLTQHVQELKDNYQLMEKEVCNKTDNLMKKWKVMYANFQNKG